MCGIGDKKGRRMWEVGVPTSTQDQERKRRLNSDKGGEWVCDSINKRSMTAWAPKLSISEHLNPEWNTKVDDGSVFLSLGIPYQLVPMVRPA